MKGISGVCVWLFVAATQLAAWETTGNSKAVNGFETDAEQIVSDKGGFTVRVGIRAPYFRMVLVEDAQQADTDLRYNYVLMCSCIYGARRAMQLFDDIEYFQVYTGRYRITMSRAAVTRAIDAYLGEHTNDELYKTITGGCRVTEFLSDGESRSLPPDEVDSVMCTQPKTTTVDWQDKDWGID
jgi:hypothetical protein